MGGSDMLLSTQRNSNFDQDCWPNQLFVCINFLYKEFNRPKLNIGVNQCSAMAAAKLQASDENISLTTIPLHLCQRTEPMRFNR